ncbi:MAG: selenium metabolism-associated LysR family transcriptional regulator [Planctomycetota bacterium]|nr:selenium metabolism-associated LysR family transcriptional regulator [Planctomycetota bacterium]
MANTDPLSIRQLEVFVALLEQKSFTKAARALGLSQSTVSGHMADLERRLGLRLVSRSRSGVEPTAAGNALLPPARQVLHAERSARMAVAELTGLLSGSLVIGGSTIPADFVLPGLLGRFHDEHPGIRLLMRAGDTQEVVDHVAAGEIDVGLVGAAPLAKGLVSFAYGEDRLVLIVRPDHPFAKRKSVSLQDVAGERIVGREEGSGTQRTILEALAEAGLDHDLHIVCRVGSTSAVKASVRAGLGLSFVSELAIQDEIEAKLLAAVPVKGFSVKRSFHCVHRRPQEMSPAARSFVDLLQSDD